MGNASDVEQNDFHTGVHFVHFVPFLEYGTTQARLASVA